MREFPRWHGLATVRVEMADWPAPVAWVGAPPDDVSMLPDRLLVLLPVGGTALDSAVISAAATAWSRIAGNRQLTVVPVPVTAARPEVG